MNIAINGWFYSKPFTGIGQYTVNLIKGLSSLYSESMNLTVYLNSDCNMNKLPDIPSVEYKIINKKTYSNDIVDILVFEQLLKKKAAEARHDILHTPYLCSPLLHGNKFRHIVTIHDVISLIFREYRGSYLRNLFLSYNEKRVKNASMIITDSENSKKDIIDYLKIDATKIHVVKLAADNLFRNEFDAKKSKEIKCKYDLPEKYIFYIGGFDFRKNVKFLLEAYAAVRKRGISDLMVIGGGYRPSDKQLDKGLVDNLPDIATSLGIHDQIRILGPIPQEDLPHIYKMARLFVYPSLYEGFGLPPLEAMACGTPVLASSCSSIPEIVNRPDLLFNPHDLESLCEKMQLLLADENLRRSTAEWGITRAAEFHWSAVTRQTFALYSAALGSG
jgi:glycosyltransferase involved in cell wall biosynthesis